MAEYFKRNSLLVVEGAGGIEKECSVISSFSEYVMTVAAMILFNVGFSRLSKSRHLRKVVRFMWSLDFS